MQSNDVEEEKRLMKTVQKTKDGEDEMDPDVVFKESEKDEDANEDDEDENEEEFPEDDGTSELESSSGVGVHTDDGRNQQTRRKMD